MIAWSMDTRRSGEFKARRMRCGSGVRVVRQSRPLPDDPLEAERGVLGPWLVRDLTAFLLLSSYRFETMRAILSAHPTLSSIRRSSDLLKVFGPHP